MSTLNSFYEAVVKHLGKLNWVPPLLTRLTVGIVFIESGWGKIHNIPKVTEFFTSLGIPAPAFQAHFVAGTEFLGGILLLIGLLTRLASIPLTVVMTVAILTAKGSEIESWSDIFGFSEYLYIVLFVYLIVQGAGSISLDFIVKKWIASRDRKRE